MRAVRFDEYGGIDVLKVVDVPRPVPGAGQVLVQVKAAGINPGEAKIREGLLHSRWPATFPSGQGSDLAGIVAETGPGVTGFSAGDEVIGWTDNRASQAEYVVVEEQHLTAKPAGVPWEVAGALFVAGATAYAAVRAVGLTEGDTVVVSGAAGGVGSLAVQLARRAGATVIGLASEAHHQWLAGHGVIPGDLRRRGGRPDPAGGWQGGRVHRHVRRGVRARWPSSSASSRPASTPSPTSRPSRGSGSRPRATRPGPARASSPSWRA